MRPIKRWLGLLLMAVAVSSPIVVAGCASHATVRVYDPYYGDYHVWNDHEVVYYRQWVVELAGPTANSARCRLESSANTGTGGTTIPIIARNRAARAGEMLKRQPADEHSPAGLDRFFAARTAVTAGLIQLRLKSPERDAARAAYAARHK